FPSSEHTFTTYSSSTIAASSIATSMHGLKWHVRSGHNLNVLISHMTDVTKVPEVGTCKTHFNLKFILYFNIQAQLKECMLHMEDFFNKHSRNMQHFCMDIQQSQTSAIYLQGRFHVQHPEHIEKHKHPSFSQMSDSLNQQKHSFKSVLPYRIKSCSNYTHSSKDIDK
ncbi:hypothetical protein KR026_002841, partial [Drosophila bipectinata]